MEARSFVDPGPVPETIGLAALSAIAFRGESFAAVIRGLLDRLAADERDAAALFDLGTILEISGRKEEGLSCQADAFKISRLFRQAATGAGGAPLRLLMLATPGDFMANTPVHFLLQDSGITLDTYYITSDVDLCAELPPHDILLNGVAESDEGAPVLIKLKETLAGWPRPVLNDPARVLSLARERLRRTLYEARSALVPPTRRIGRGALASLDLGAIEPGSPFAPGGFPIIVRPIGSHAGRGLRRLDSARDIAGYLRDRSEEFFSISPFVDYRSADGLFRKYRIAMIAGRPFLCHVAIAKHWMLHYLNAGMAADAKKRAEEARLMAGFDAGFATRHAAALHDVACLAGLDYFGVDCAETRDGRLLIFEADTAMIIHDMDPPALFPYKGPAMRKAFSAFRAMLRERAAAGKTGPEKVSAAA